MKRFSVVVILTVALLDAIASTSVFAAPVWDETYHLRQPDGELVATRIWGDEFYQVVESPDGYTLIRDPNTGVICYAKLSADGRELLSTGTRVDSAAKAGLGLKAHLRIHPEAARMQAFASRARFQARNRLPKLGAQPAPPNQGEVRGLCLLIEFPDETHTIDPSEADALCNEIGYTGNGNNGSVRDYFYDVSNGAFAYTSFVPGAYYMALHNKGYYDNPAEESGPKASELVVEALTDLDNHGFDFSQYDANGDGFVDGVNCFYVGSTQSGWAHGLWPHSGSTLFEADGVAALQYQICDMGNTLYIGTFCHENGHMICWWPDLYDYDYDSAGAGRYCLMAFGSQAARNPIEPCAYLKDLAGWTTTHLLGTAPQMGLVADSGSNVVYKYENALCPNEYFLVENRQKAGRDVYLPADGLALWHIDRLGNNSFNEMTPDRHFEAALVQADGQFELEHDVNSGNATDLWKSPTYVLCGPNTAPNTNWWNGSPSYLRVSNVSASGTSMTFDYRGAGDPTADYDDDGISDWDETRDLDPAEPGVQNPFDPTDPDVTGDNGENTPDDIPDGENDYDGDGLSNAEEFMNGSNPIVAEGELPATSSAGLVVLGAALVLSMTRAQRKTGRRSTFWS